MGGFQFLTIINKTAVNIHAQVLVSVQISFLQDKRLVVQLLNRRGSVCLDFKEIVQLFSRVARPFCICTSTVKSFSFFKMLRKYKGFLIMYCIRCSVRKWWCKSTQGGATALPSLCRRLQHRSQHLGLYEWLVNETRPRDGLQWTCCILGQFPIEPWFTGITLHVIFWHNFHGFFFAIPPKNWQWCRFWLWKISTSLIIESLHLLWVLRARLNIN